MSQENVEIVRRSVELWNKEEWSGFGAVYDPNVVVVPPDDWPDGEVSMGRDAWIRQSIRLKEPWKTDQLRSDDVREVGDSIVVRLNWTTMGKGSGIGVATDMWGVYTLLAHKIVRVAFFLERSRALEAVGMSEQAMSNDNVEIVRRVYEAAARDDTAAIFELYDSDIEWDASRTERGTVTGQVARGKEALLKWLREWYEAWETIDDDLEELIEVGDDKVISVMVQRGRGRASGIEVADRLWTVWTIREGKVIRVVWFPTRREAFEAAGLSE